MIASAFAPGLPLATQMPTWAALKRRLDERLIDIHHWKRADWGDHYPLLARAKRKHDPRWIFRGWNCVEHA